MSVRSGTEMQAWLRGPYFIALGGTAAAVLIMTGVVRLRLGEFGWMFTWQMIALASCTALAALLVAVIPMWNPATEAFLLTGSKDAGCTCFSAMVLGLAGGFVGIAALGLLVLDHRKIVVAVALLQGWSIISLRRRAGESAPVPAVLVVTLVAWALSAGLMYTRIGDWLLAAGPTEAWAVWAFAAAFALSAQQLATSALPACVPSRRRWIVAVVWVLVFAAFAFRQDHYLADWVPYHESLFADVAQSVKDGHVLLWDVPSLYGFLSILTIASVPVANAFDGLHVVTGVILTFETTVIFAILRYRNRGWANALFAGLFALGAIGENMARFDWGARLYPQASMRFVWLIALLAVSFGIYAQRGRLRVVTVLRIAGWFVWVVSLLWSIECAIWSTVVWLPYVVADAAFATASPMPSGRRYAMWAAYTVPFVAIPLMAALAIGRIYQARFGHGPDWRGLAEFVGLFTGGQVRAIFHVQPYGGAWTFLLVFGAVAAVGFVALRRRDWDLVRLLGAVWLVVWAASSYYAVEPLEEYVPFLIVVLVAAAAVLIAVTRELVDSPAATMARLSVIPLATIVIALVGGEPGRLATATFPFGPGWIWPATQAMPELPRELHALMQRAGVPPGGRVVFENGPLGDELVHGLILGFTRDAAGRMVEYRSWLPESPSGPQALYAMLAPARQSRIVQRFLGQEREGGWYVAYRRTVRCAELSPMLVDSASVASVNYRATRCTLRHP